MNNTNSDLLNENPDASNHQESNPSKIKKIIRITIPAIILLISFFFGFIYFFNFEVIARYMLQKGGYPLDIDKLDVHLSGKFNMERLKYTFQNRQGVSDQLKIEYTGGSISILKIIFSKKLDMNVNVRSVKIPFEGGMISAGSWNITSFIGNLQKNQQQWDGDLTISVSDAMIQYTMMNSNYVALVKSGKIKGHIKNSIFQLETSEILTDIAKITLTGNTTIVYPYNVNIQMNILPLEEFSKKYPNEQNMISALLQKNPNLIVNLTGTMDKLNPQIQNLQN